MVELVTISARIPKQLNDALEEYTAEHGYASKTEVLREWLRGLLYENIHGMKGALKGKVKSTESRAWRENEWKTALKEVNGDAKKAAILLDEKERKALSGLRL